MARVCIAGIWHQGSVLSACLADMGHQVTGVDSNESTVSGLNQGEAPLYEPRLNAIIRRNLRAGRLSYTTDYQQAVSDADFAFISIDTPVGPNDESDLSSIFETARRIAGAASGTLILTVSAQVPVGTCEYLSELISQENPSVDFKVAYVPEFLRLGSAVDTFRRADRFVVGADEKAVARQVAALFEHLDRSVVITDLRTAEMAKHACNTFLATSISFINEIADVCHEVGADVLQVAQIMKLDRRIGKYAFLSPGLGFAGGTLGREIRALQQLGSQHHCKTALLDAVMEINSTRSQLVSHRLKAMYEMLPGLQVGMWGLTYKAGTSTLRRSAALEIVQDLSSQGVAVRAFDPLAQLDEVTDLPPFEVEEDCYSVAEGSDALVLVTEWSGMQNVDLARLRSLMRRPVFIDTRNLFEPAEMARLGFIYSGIGRNAESLAMPTHRQGDPD